MIIATFLAFIFKLITGLELSMQSYILWNYIVGAVTFVIGVLNAIGSDSSLRKGMNIGSRMPLAAWLDIAPSEKRKKEPRLLLLGVLCLLITGAAELILSAANLLG